MDEEGGGDRWSIGDLRRDRSPLPRVDRLLAGLDASTPVRDEIEMRLERLELRVDEFEHRLGALTGRTSPDAAGYTLFTPGSGRYEIVERDGVAPDVGAAVSVAGARFVVERTRRSPFPSDARPCLVLSPLPKEQAADEAAADA
jgi:hypothetical protein